MSQSRWWQQSDSVPLTPLTETRPTTPIGSIEPVFDLTSAESQADTSSLLYIMLPRMVKNRIRRLPSFRRSISSTIGRTTALDENEDLSRRSSGEFEAESGFHTPPPGYRSRMSMALAEHVSYDEYAEEETPQPEQRTPFFEDARSGVDWKFANQGLNLLNLAVQESSTQTPSSASSTPTLARQLYVHGLTYLLRALPQDLSPDEKLSVWSSIPDEVLELSHTAAATQDLVVVGTDHDAGARNAPPSLVHRALATVIVNLFLVFNFLLPYIKVFLTSAYQYERRHRITERLFASSVSTMDVAMKRSVEISNRICSLNHGKVGLALNEFVVWWIRGVTGGIHQGVGEGLVIMGIDTPESPPSPRRGKQRR